MDSFVVQNSGHEDLVVITTRSMNGQICEVPLRHRDFASKLTLWQNDRLVGHSKRSGK
jgi:hypothetical protein